MHRPTASLLLSLPDLRKYSYLALGMWAATEVALALLMGEVAPLLTKSDLNVTLLMIYAGGTAGVAAGILWLGNALPARGRLFRWVAVCLGLVVLGWWYQRPSHGGLRGPTAFIAFAAFPLGVLVMGQAILTLRDKARLGFRRTGWAYAFLWLALLSLALAFGTLHGLELSAFLFPQTWDHFLYHLDAGLGWPLAAQLAKAFHTNQWLLSAGAVIYGLLVPGFGVAIAVAIRAARVHDLNIWRLYVLPYLAAWLLYAWIPASGPIYAFFSAGYPLTPPAPDRVPALLAQMPVSPRNAMPSMHLSGALFVFLIAVACRYRWAVGLSCLLLAGTFLTTLGLGEHYLIDLVVALPFALTLSAALVRPRLFSSPAARSALLLNGGLTIAWLLSIRTFPAWLAGQSVILWLATLVTLVGFAWGALVLLRDVRRPATRVRYVQRPAEAAPTGARWIAALFLCSGVAGLLYEVVFSKALAVTFGSTALASYTVLATYMGGMAIGAWVGGKLAERVSHALKAYAVCEVLIGVYAVLTPLFFNLVQALYASLAADVSPSSPVLSAMRVTLGAIVLGIPTILMGATLPLMFKHIRQYESVSAPSAIARLYGANVLGAALGSLIAGYVLLPALGRDGATYLAALASLLIGLYAFEKNRALAKSPVAEALPPVRVPHEAAHEVALARAPVVLGLIVLILGGAVTLGLEVVYIHLLAVVAGNSAYAFALMLSAFLAGLGFGSEAGRRCQAVLGPVATIALAEMGLGFAIALTSLGWDGIPQYFAGFGAVTYTLPFSGREFIRAMVCLLVMVPPAFCIGMAYPAAMSISVGSGAGKREAARLGTASALNTVGNIAGVLLTGFLLLPYLGSLQVVMLFTVVALALSAYSLWVQIRVPEVSGSGFAASRFVRVAPVLWGLCALTAWGATPRDWNYQELTTGSNVYFGRQFWGKHVEHAESVAGGLTSVAVSPDGVYTLLTNGKFQGNNAKGGEVLAQAGFALAPLLHTQRRESALVIGYGTGMTSNVIQHAGFRNVEVAELSADILRLADKYFAEINEGVLKRPGVVTHVTDGRNFLLTQNRNFDLISIEISSIWFAGAANLYNKEFYELVRRRLSTEGVLQQWVQLHHIQPIDLIYVLGSVRANFKYVWLYYIGGQGIIVASNSEQAFDHPSALKRLTDAPEMARYITMFSGHPENLLSDAVLRPQDVDRLIGGLDPQLRVVVSTDSNLYLEYSTPKGNALTQPDLVARNLAYLRKMAGVQQEAAPR